MFNLDSWWLPLLLRVRFTRIIMWMEKMVISFIAWKWIHGDITDYTQIRCDAYKLWTNGYDAPVIASALRLPLWLVNNWASIWQLYIDVLGEIDGQTSESCEGR